MTVRCYLHSIAKRAKVISLVDSGATENFLNLTYAKWLWLPIKKMKDPWKLFNVDGTENKAGELQYYTDLETRMGTTTHRLHFFLSDLGEHKTILEYPWFVAVQPNIDWKKGWIDHTQLPIILKAPNMQRAVFIPWMKNVPHTKPEVRYFIGRVTIQLKQLCTLEKGRIPKEYQRHGKVFSEEKSQWLPTTWKSLQWREIPTITITHDLRPCYRTPSQCTSNPPCPAPPAKPTRTRRNAEICKRAPP
jgi:hypothetical protein